MKDTPTPPRKKQKPQLGVRIDPNLLVEVKVLAVRQRRNLNELVEEALIEILKKYDHKG